MSDEVKCPYCGHYNPVEENEDDTYEETCEKCGKIFGVTVNWWPSYSARELPNRNGKEPTCKGAGQCDYDGTGCTPDNNCGEYESS